jgi:hypothetical protein
MEDRMSDRRVSSPGEFLGAVLFCVVLPLISMIGLVIDYVRHVR